MNRKFFTAIWALTVTFTSAARADEYFRQTRVDQTVPEECRDLGIKNFSAGESIKYITLSINNAKEHGFTHEYELDRDDAEWLWRSYRHNGHPEPSARTTRLDREVVLIDQYKDIMGLDFGSEGQVLELLGLVSLKDEYPDNQYFQTGGLEYHESASSETMGELDLLVGERATCQIVVIGEAKLGVHAIDKATEQLKRIHDFLGRHLPKN